MGKSSVAQQLLGPFTRLARAMSKNWEVTVHASGHACDTDGRSQIRIPFNSDHFKDAEQQVLHGLLDHEVQHVVEEREAEARKASGSACITPSEAMRACKSNHEKMILNAFEDVRIETKSSSQYPGVAENLHKANLRSVDMMRRAHAEGKVHNFWHQIASAIVLKARGYDAGWVDAPVQPYVDAIAEEIEASKTTTCIEDCHALTLKVLEKVAAKMEEARLEREEREAESDAGESEEEAEAGSESSDGEAGDDVGEESADGEDELADEAEGDEAEGDEAEAEGDEAEGDEAEAEGDEAEGDEAEAEGDEAEGEGGEAEGEGGEAEGDEAEGDEAEGDEAEGGGGTSTKAGGESSDGEPGEAGDGSETADVDASEEPEAGPDSDDSSDARVSGATKELTDDELDAVIEAGEIAARKDADVAELMDFVKDEIEEIARKDATAHHRYIPNPEIAAWDEWVRPDPNEERYNALREEIVPQISTLRSKLLSVLRTRSAARHTSDHESGKIDQSTIYSLRMGNKRVFSQRTPEAKVDTAVSILLDLSGSMEGDKIKCAAQMAIALGETLDALGVPFEIIGFHNALTTHTRADALGYAARRSHDAKYSRTLPFQYHLFKSFNESYKPVRARLGSVNAYEQNVDGEAVFVTAQRLAERKEKRKMLFVLSDGEPCGGCITSHARAHLNEVVKRITKAGIEVFGIGCQYESVKNYYNKENGSSYVVIRDTSKLAFEVFKLVRERLMAGSPEAA